MCPLGYRCGRSEQHLPGGLSHPLREELGGGGGAEEAEEEGEEGGAAPALRYQGILPHSQQEQQALTHQTKHCQPLQASKRWPDRCTFSPLQGQPHVLFHLCQLLWGCQPDDVLIHLSKPLWGCQPDVLCHLCKPCWGCQTAVLNSFTSASIMEADGCTVSPLQASTVWGCQLDYVLNYHCKLLWGCPTHVLIHLCNLLWGCLPDCVLIHLCKFSDAARKMYSSTSAIFSEAAIQMYSFTSASFSEAASQMCCFTSASLKLLWVGQPDVLIHLCNLIWGGHIEVCTLWPLPSELSDLVSDLCTLSHPARKFPIEPTGWEKRRPMLRSEPVVLNRVKQLLYERARADSVKRAPHRVRSKLPPTGNVVLVPANYTVRHYGWRHWPQNAQVYIHWISMIYVESAGNSFTRIHGDKSTWWPEHMVTRAHGDQSTWWPEHMVTRAHGDRKWKSSRK